MSTPPTDKWIQIQATKKRGHPTSEDTTMDYKHATPSDHWLNPTVTSNRFTPIQPDEDPEHSSLPGKNSQPKPPPIYITNVTTVPPLLKLLDQITPQLYDLKALANNQVRVQPHTPDSYRLITKALLDRHTQFHTYKPKEDRPYRVVLRNMHYSIDPAEIKAEINNLGHTVTNIWNVKHSRTKQPLPMFFIDLLPAPNNKAIFQVEFLQRCKISFEPPKHSRDIPQCANCQRYGHTKNFCHLQPRCVKCAGDHTTAQCSRKERSSAVKCILCNGNHPANYKGCSVYKDLRNKTYQPLRQKHYTPPAPLQQTLHTSPGVTYAQVAKHSISNPVSPAQNVPPAPTFTSHHPSNEIQDLKNMMKTLFDQLGTMLSLLTTVLSKLH